MKIRVKIPHTTRAHLVLFCKDTPFKPKRVKNKLAYNRKQKHTKKESAE
jgi:hypothetical protein